MKYIALFITVLFLTTSSYAQQSAGKISGVINDNAGKPFAAATVSLLNAKDSVLLKVAVTGKDGQYEFASIPEGNYILTANAVGFGKVKAKPLSFTQPSNGLQVETLVLHPEAKGLQGVTVTAKKTIY